MAVASEGKVEANAITGTDTAAVTTPDPTRQAKIALYALLALSVLAAIVLNAAGLTNKPFDPALAKDANFALLAGFYIGAQVIERLLEPIAAVMPPWDPPGTTDPEKLAHTRADRAAVMLGIATLAGVAVSCAFGLFFLETIKIEVSNTIDVLATGLVIGAGTKPLHDFISSLQKKAQTPTPA